MKSNLFKFFAGVAVAIIAALGIPSPDLFAGAAMLQGHPDCGSVYRVAKGDTLHTIAVRAYGTGDYEAIFKANRGVLASVSSIEIGDELMIPCRGGTGPNIGTRFDTRAAAVGSPEIEASAPAIVPDKGESIFVTGSDFAPFVHSALPEGGMVTELVRLAMSNAAPERSVKIALVENWSAHLDMLKQGSFDLGFPWYKPDCRKAALLSASMRQRCTQFDFSDPLFEVAIGYYALSDNPVAASTRYAQLSGRRICRPANYFTFDLAQAGLAAPKATLVIAPTLSNCFTWLDQGKVDVVTLSKPLAEDEIVRRGFEGRVTEILALASVQTLHAVAPKGDPNGRAALDLVNAGLAELQSSGRWFEVASRHLGTYGARVR